MKKLSITLVVLLVSMLAVSKGFAVKSGNSYFADDFQEQTGWESLAGYGWTSGNGGAVTIGEDGSNKYLNILTPWGSSICKEFETPLTGFVGIEFDMAVSYPSVSHFGFLDANGATQNLLYFDWANNVCKPIFAPEWLNVPLELQDGEWVKVKLLANIANNSCSMWVTKQGQTPQAIFLNYVIPFSGGLKGIVFNYPAWYLSSDGNNFKLDNVDIYREVLEETEGFEDASVIGDAIGWSSSNNPGVSIAQQDGNQFLKINSPWENVVTKAFVTPYEENITLEMKIQSEDAKGQYLRVIDQSGAAHNVLCFYKTPEGKNQLIYTYGGKWFVTPIKYADDTWIRLKLIINMQHKQWAVYANGNVEGTGYDQFIFQDDIANFDKILGLQFHYPVHWPEDGKDFCIDDVKVTLGNAAQIGENAYQIGASVAVNNQPVPTSAELYALKDNPAKLNLTVSRLFDDSIFSADCYYGLYQGYQLIGLQKGTLAFDKSEKQKILTFDMDLSKLTSDELKVKVFLWHGENYFPLIPATDVFE